MYVTFKFSARTDVSTRSHFIFEQSRESFVAVDSNYRYLRILCIYNIFDYRVSVSDANGDDQSKTQVLLSDRRLSSIQNAMDLEMYMLYEYERLHA